MSKLTAAERRFLSKRIGLTATERTNFLEKLFDQLPKLEAASIREALREVDAEVEAKRLIEEQNEVFNN